jgi:hypothetical protein
MWSSEVARPKEAIKIPKYSSHACALANRRTRARFAVVRRWRQGGPSWFVLLNKCPRVVVERECKIIQRHLFAIWMFLRSLLVDFRFIEDRRSAAMSALLGEGLVETRAAPEAFSKMPILGFLPSGAIERHAKTIRYLKATDDADREHSSQYPYVRPVQWTRRSGQPAGPPAVTFNTTRPYETAHPNSPTRQHWYSKCIR